MITNIAKELFGYLKLAEGLAYLHRLPPDPDYKNKIRRYIENREDNFLGMAHKVLSLRDHPYAQIFATAGCTYADLETEVRKNGLENTLEALLREGVYLTLDEFRCTSEIVRGGRHIPAKLTDWDNAAGKGPLQAFSSGSSGGPKLRTSLSLQASEFGMAGMRLLNDEFGVQQRPSVIVGAILPGNVGIAGCTTVLRLGGVPERWFALGGSIRENGHYRALTAAMVTRLRIAGAKVPYPTYLEADDFSPVAEYIARRKKEGVLMTLGGFVSSVARVAGAALDLGLDISGTFSMVSGESLTDVKRALIESAGIEVYPIYGASDFGGIGMPCRHMNSGDCVHVSRASIALVSRAIENPYGEEEINSLHVSALLPFAPRVLINVEIGDTGVIEPATCDCELSRMGYTLQVRDIAAFSKVCGQGVTIHAQEMVRLLEEALPARFGGRPGDYQLLEIEGKGQTEMVLRVHPRLKIASVQDVLNYFLSQTRSKYGGALAAVQWTQSNGVRVEVKEPVLTSSGKCRVVRLLGSGTKTASAAAAQAAMAKSAGSGRS